MVDEGRMIQLAQELYDTCKSLRYGRAAPLFVLDVGFLIYQLAPDPVKAWENVRWFRPMLVEQKCNSYIVDFSRAEKLGRGEGPLRVPDTVCVFYRYMFPRPGEFRLNQMRSSLKKSLEFFSLWGNYLLGDDPDPEQKRRLDDLEAAILDYVNEKVIIENMK